MSPEPPQTAVQVAETVLQDPQERKRLTAFALSHFGIRHEDAQDLLQDVAVELLRQRKSIHSPRGFVFSIFRRSCWKLVLRRRTSGQLVPLTEAEPSTGGADRLDIAITIREGLGAVSSTCRKLLAAHYISGQTLRETAATAALAYSGLPTIISRCLKRLRACLA